MSWTYDGWGNRLQQSAVKGSVPTMVSITDPATNRIQAHTYDANGNTVNTVNTPQQGAMTYDVINRLKTVAADTYGYDPSNKRVWKNDEYTFWGAAGERIGRYSAVKLVNDVGAHVFVFQKVQVDEYFGGRRLTSQDRLGSVGQYYPYGEAKSGTVSNADSFATYYRDSTGLDYAQQRSYQPSAGRFVTTDPLQSSAVAAVPASWNRYAYGLGDSVNRIDPSGLDGFACTFDSSGTRQFTCSFEVTDEAGKTYRGTSTQNQLLEAQAFAEAGAYVGRGLDLAVDLLAQNPGCASIFSTPEKRLTNLWDPRKFIRRHFSGDVYLLSGPGTYVYTQSFINTGLPVDLYGVTVIEMVITRFLAYGSITTLLNREYLINAGQSGHFEGIAGLLLHELGHVYQQLEPLGSGGARILPDGPNNPLMNGIRNDQLIGTQCHAPLYQGIP